jgi:DNA-binding Xre family transcriptional regulator
MPNGKQAAKKTGKPKPKGRKYPPFAVTKNAEHDPRVPAPLRRMPHRIEQANDAGPRYNQSELAQKSGLAQSVISKLTRSSNLYGVRLETIYKLAAALKVSVSWLLGESDSPERKPRRRSPPAPPAPTATRKRSGAR